MKLARKLTLAMVLGMTVVLAIHGVFQFQRDLQFLKRDMERDHQLPARVLGTAVADIWRTHGKAQALRLIDDANGLDGRVRIRWLDGAPGRDGMRGGRFYSYAPVTAEGVRLGTLEISESFDAEAAYVRASVARTITATVAMALVAAAIAMALGMVFVGGPMRRLADKARRVGAGDLSGPLDLRQRDEIGQLAREMNAMCERLSEAHEHIASETAARLAALEQLRHADRLATVGKLASGIAHELGTPLNVVSLRAKMIASREATGPEAVACGRIIGEQTDRITRIIRELLDFARGRGATRAGDQFVEKAPADLRKIAGQTLALLKPLAEKRQASLELHAGARPATAVVDAGQIQQVLTNLVVNGLQAMPRPGRIAVEVAEERAVPPADHGGSPGSYLKVAVRDEGEGIAPDVLPHVFEPFFTTKEVGEGTGLGLSVSYGIVREHGGWIAVDARPGAGSCFSIYLPQG